MNHVPARGVRTDQQLGTGARDEDSLTRAQVAIDEILAEAYERGELGAVRTLHAVASLLAAVRH